MSDRNLSPVELAILRMLRETGGVPATKLTAPWRTLERLVSAKLVSLESGHSHVALTPLGESLLATLPGEEPGE